MTNYETPQEIENILARLENNPVATFSYTDKAFEDDVIDGVENYDFHSEQNIPKETRTDFNPTILQKGMRSQASSIPRDGLNHFFGRVSFNLNKLVQLVKSFLIYMTAFSAHNCNEYNPNMAYKINDLCYIVQTQNEQKFISVFRRKSNNPIELQGVSPLLDADQWESIQRSRTITVNDDSIEPVVDTGEDLSLPVPVTITQPEPSEERVGAGTRSLRDTIQLLAGNLAFLFANRTTYHPNTVLHLCQLTKEAELNALYGGTWRRALTPVRVLTILSTPGSKNSGVTALLNRTVPIIIPQIADIVISFQTECEYYTENMTIQIISSTRGVIQTRSGFMRTGTIGVPCMPGYSVKDYYEIQFNSVTLQDDEALFFKITSGLSPINIRAIWNSPYSAKPEYCYVREDS